jgi:CDP-glucose 4,6-dehydratase
MLHGKYGNSIIKISPMDIATFYKNKKVFITGHTGFKGSWLTAILHSFGAEVKGYALEPETNPSLYQAIHGDSLCYSIIGDVRDASFLHKHISEFAPDIVFHLAAQPIVRTSYDIPVDTFEINAMGTVNVLEAIRQMRKKCIAVLITTDKVYENNESGQAYKENNRLGGYDPYSSSKACAELIIDSYRKSFFNPQKYSTHQVAIASARAGNVIGGGDWAKDRLLPDIVRALVKNETINIRNPKAVRPWQHVLEPLWGYLTLAMKMEEDPIVYTDAFNFGPYPYDVLTVKEITDLAVRIWGKGNVAFPKLQGQVHEAGLLSLSIEKAKKVLRWKPKLNAEKALTYTLEWYKNYYDKNANMLEFTINQLSDYQKI